VLQNTLNIYVLGHNVCINNKNYTYSNQLLIISLQTRLWSHGKTYLRSAFIAYLGLGLNAVVLNVNSVKYTLKRPHYFCI